MGWRRIASGLVVFAAACGGPAPTASNPPVATFDVRTPTPQPTPRLAGLWGDAPTEVAPAEVARGELPGPPAAASFAIVTRVVDGDTVVLDGIGVGKRDSSTSGRHARLIGVDTPEVYGGAECYGSQASAFTKAALNGRDVLVSMDVDQTDRYDRALVYIWTLDGAFFNARLLLEGYASQLTIPPNVRYADLFRELAREAREGSRGLWSACEDGSGAEQTPGTQGGGGPGAATSPSGNCHASYPDYCIPPPPPDLDCPDMDSKRFTVRHDVPDPDPHRFDGDRNGLGCES